MIRFGRTLARVGFLTAMFLAVLAVSTPARGGFPPPKDLVITPPTGTGGEKEVDPPIITPPPVHCDTPEPATMVLAVIGAAGVGVVRTFRRKQTV